MRRLAIVLVLLACAALVPLVVPPDEDVVRPRATGISPALVPAGVASAASMAPEPAAVASVSPVRQPEACAGPELAGGVVGRVVQADGGPVAGAEVELGELVGEPPERRLLARVLAGPTGAFRFEAGEPGSRRFVTPYDPVRGLRGGRVPVEGSSVDLGDVVVTDRAGRLDVVVRIAGRTVADALVRCRLRWAGPSRVEHARTDAAGRVTFVVDDLSEGVALRVEHEGGVAERHHVAVGRDDVELALDLEPAQRLAGSVVDCVGRPVPGVRVEATDLPVCGRAARGAITDAAGSFAFEGLVPRDRLVVAAVKVEARLDVLTSRPVRVRPEDRRCVLRLERAALVARPRDGTRLHALERQTDDGRWDPLVVTCDRSSGSLWFVAPGCYRVVSDSGEVGPAARAEARGADLGASITFVKPPPNDRLRTVRGRVRAPDGRPLARAAVSVLWGGWSITPGTPLSALDGTFSLQVSQDSRLLGVDAGAGPTWVPLQAGVTDLGDVVVDAPLPRRRRR